MNYANRDNSRSKGKSPRRQLRPRIGEKPKPADEPKLMILGQPCDATEGDHGRHYDWREGPVRVTIEPSYDSDKERWDWRVSITMFEGDPDSDSHGEPVLQVWRMTPEAAASYAERRLGRVLRALQEARKGAEPL